MSRPIVKEKDDWFQCALIHIQVEDRLFIVPRELFETYSDVFSDMFKLPRVDNQPQDGDMEDRPLFLDGIKKMDFRAFLTVLSTHHYDSAVALAAKPVEETIDIKVKTNLLITRHPYFPTAKIVLGQEQWISVLRLSHMWSFADVQRMAIDALEQNFSDSFTQFHRLRLANELHITKWMRSACNFLITRSKSLQASEVPWMGADFVSKVAQARTMFMRLFLMRLMSHEMIYTTTCPICGKSSLKECEPEQADSTGTSRCRKFRCSQFEGHTQGSSSQSLKSEWTLEEILEFQSTCTRSGNVPSLQRDVNRLIDGILPLS